MSKVWTCPECAVETRFKGLCRECTEYDGDGTPVKPIQRVRLNWTPTIHNPNIQRTKRDYLSSRQRKPTNKQIAAIKEHLNSQSKAVAHQHTEECGEDCDHNDFHEIGESIGSEEE
tara:strand:+ start:369 stop:716 length:348 start_codon:yes stop_codon:yes gene_type:complete